MSQLWVWHSTFKWPNFSGAFSGPIEGTIIPYSDFRFNLFTSFCVFFLLPVLVPTFSSWTFCVNISQYEPPTKSVLRKKGKIEILRPISNSKLHVYFPKDYNSHVLWPIEYILPAHLLTLLMLLESRGGLALWTCLKLDKSIVTGCYQGLSLSRNVVKFLLTSLLLKTVAPSVSETYLSLPE